MKSIIILTFFYFNFCLSQSAEIKYSIFIEPIEKKSIKDESEYINNCIKIANKLNFTLKFNKDISSFKLNEYTKENDLYDIAIVMAGNENVYVNNRNKEILVETNEKVLITENYNDRKWLITKESKKIDDFQCFKAIFKYNQIDRNGINRSNEIIAWFTPKLPFSYGPKNYYGLPGLILEVTQNKVTYLATKIELSNKDIVLTIPKRKSISRDEYNQKLKSQMGM